MRLLFIKERTLEPAQNSVPSHTQQPPGFLLTFQPSDAGSRPVSVAPSQLYLCLDHPSQPPSIRAPGGPFPGYFSKNLSTCPCPPTIQTQAHSAEPSHIKDTPKPVTASPFHHAPSVRTAGALRDPPPAAGPATSPSAGVSAPPPQTSSPLEVSSSSCGARGGFLPRHDEIGRAHV